MRKYLFPMILFLCLIVFWELGISFWKGGAVFLPKPSRILMALSKRPLLFWQHLRVTLLEMILAWIFALVASFPLGYLMYRSKFIRQSAEPLFILVQCLPMFTLAPLMLLIFGWGVTAIVVPTALMVFFPLTLAVYQGLRAMPKEMEAMANLLHASAWKKFVFLELPYSLTHLFQGLKVSTAILGIGAIAGEWAGAQKGLGIFMIESRRVLDFENLFGALFLLVIASLIFYAFVSFLERCLIKRKYVQIRL